LGVVKVRKKWENIPKPAFALFGGFSG